MKHRTSAAAWTLTGAVIGAGFASGREIASFFSRWGAWSLLAVISAAAVMAVLSRQAIECPGIPACWQGRWQERLWKIMFAALLTVTGGAMTAAAGELAALTIPLHGMRVTGMAGSLLLAAFLAGKETPWLARLSKALALCLTFALLTGLMLPSMRGVALDAPAGWTVPWRGLWSGVCYGGFNAALAAPVLGEAASGLSGVQKRRASRLGSGMLALLLLGGNAVMLRHPALQGESMPLIMLTSQLGKPGFFLGAAMLYLAVMTTLLACIRGASVLLGRRWPVIIMGAVSLLGFSGTVDVLYPLLGGGCFLLLAAANFRNWSNGAFHSGKPMV